MPRPDFQDMYREQYDRIYQYAYMLLLDRENAEDVVQETFLSAYRSYERFDPARGSIGAWLCRIAHNKAIDLQRSAAYRMRADWPEGVEFGEEDPAIRLYEEKETVLFLYTRLSEEERELLTMRYVLELKDAEVAAILGMKEKTVNKRYQRLLKKSLKILSPNDPQDRI